MLPPDDLQLRFSKTIESIGASKVAAALQSVALETLFTSLQSRAFSGQL